MRYEVAHISYVYVLFLILFFFLFSFCNSVSYCSYHDWQVRKWYSSYTYIHITHTSHSSCIIILAVKICLWHNVVVLIDLYFINNSSLWREHKNFLFLPTSVHFICCVCVCIPWVIFDLRKCRSRLNNNNTNHSTHQKKLIEEGNMERKIQYNNRIA